VGIQGKKINSVDIIFGGSATAFPVFKVSVQKGLF
jgi:hypothetical protein